MLSLEFSKTIKSHITAKLADRILQDLLRFLKIKKKVQVSVVLVSDAKIKRLNKLYRHKNKATDVLSFAEHDVIASFPNTRSANYLGEIIISLETLKKQAKQQKHSLYYEFTVLLTHGFLHLLGYDHQKETDAQVMEALEAKFLKFTMLDFTK